MRIFPNNTTQKDDMARVVGSMLGRHHPRVTHFDVLIVSKAPFTKGHNTISGNRENSLDTINVHLRCIMLLECHLLYITDGLWT